MNLHDVLARKVMVYIDGGVTTQSNLILYIIIPKCTHNQDLVTWAREPYCMDYKVRGPLNYIMITF